jgi:hypothetical protein
MRIFWLLFPAGLGVLVLGAHLVFHGWVVALPLALVLFALLWVRRPWAARALQAALALGAAEWVRTLLASASERRAAGQPWLRMAIILGAVALVSLAGAALLESPALRRRFGRSGRAGAPRA